MQGELMPAAIGTGEAADHIAEARSRAERTMSMVQTAAEDVMLVAPAAGGGRSRSWWLPWTT